MPTAAAGRREAPHSTSFSATVSESDPELAGIIGRELTRQQQEIELIASENIVSRAVLEAAGSMLTNKYAEGYPGNRYYGGCQYVDEAENLAIARAKKPSVPLRQVQPHSGSTANQAAFMPDEARRHLMGSASMPRTSHHGSPVNLSGKWFRSSPTAAAQDQASTWTSWPRSPASTSPGDVAAAARTAHPRFPSSGDADEVRAYLMVDRRTSRGSSPAARTQPVPELSRTSTAQDAAARRAMILTNEGTSPRRSTRRVPGHAGGPLMHVIAARRWRFTRRCSPSSRLMRAPWSRLQGLGEVLATSGFDLVSAAPTRTAARRLPPRSSPAMSWKSAGRAHITVNKNGCRSIRRSRGDVVAFASARRPDDAGLGVAEFVHRAHDGRSPRWLAAKAKRATPGQGQVRRGMALCARFPIYA